MKLLPPMIRAPILRFYRRIEQAEIDLIAAGVAFFAFLAIFPAAAAVIAIWGFVSDPEIIRGEVALLAGILPPDVYKLVLGQVESLLAVNSSSLGWATAISTLLALWSARAGVAALIRGLNAIHHLPNRSCHCADLGDGRIGAGRVDAFCGGAGDLCLSAGRGGTAQRIGRFKPVPRPNFRRIGCRLGVSDRAELHAFETAVAVLGPFGFNAALGVGHARLYALSGEFSGL